MLALASHCSVDIRVGVNSVASISFAEFFVEQPPRTTATTTAQAVSLARFEILSRVPPSNILVNPSSNPSLNNSSCRSVMELEFVSSAMFARLFGKEWQLACHHSRLERR